MLELLKQDGFIFEKVSSGKGGVYKGPCPMCGGDDRFTVTPNDSYGGSYICNQCDFAGDKIKYLRDFRGMSYFEACAELNIKPKLTYQTSRDLLDKQNKPHEPKEIPNPPPTWQKKSTDLTFAFYKNLLSAPGKQYRDFLTKEKSLTIQTIQKARLGFNPSGMKFIKQIFGLPEIPDDKNTVWIALGIVIPYFLNEQLIRNRVRQENPSPGFGRYLMQTGSSSTFFIYPNWEPLGLKPVVIVEAELDGWLLWQECSDLINVIASGSSNNYPCIISDGRIKDCSQVYVWGDNDEAGSKMNSWYEKQYSAIPIHTSIGEDVSHASSRGLNIREFIIQQLNPDDTPFENSQENTTQIDDIIIPEKIRENKIKPHEPTQKPVVEIINNCLEKIKEPIEKVSLDELPLKIPENSIKNPIEKIREKKMQDRDCYNTGFCGRLQDGNCLLSKTSIHDMEICANSPPRWKRWVDSTRTIEQIIIEPRLNNKKY